MFFLLLCIFDKKVRMQWGGGRFRKNYIKYKLYDRSEILEHEKNCDNIQKRMKCKMYIDIDDNKCYICNNLITKTFNVDELKKPAVSVGFFVFYAQSVECKKFTGFKKVSAGKPLF